MSQSSPTADPCPRCQRLKKRLAKVLAENEELHQLAAHYREREELRRTLETLPPDICRH